MSSAPVQLVRPSPDAGAESVQRRFAISPNELLVFGAIARAGGIRGAAAALQLPKSTVSRQLAQLEATLGGKLVTRTTRRFQLTELGLALVQHSQQLEDVLRASEEVALRELREPTGTLKVAASPIVGEEFLPEVIATFLARYRKVKLDVALSTDFVDLRKSGIDVAIRNGPIEDATDVYAVKLGTSTKGHFASPGYLAERGTPRQPSELSSHDCVVVGARGGRWNFRPRVGAELAIQVNGRIRVDNYRLARTAAEGGAGIVRLPKFFASAAVAEGRLVPVLEAFAPKTELFAVHTAGHPAPPKIRAFLDVLKAELGPRLE